MNKTETLQSLFPIITDEIASRDHEIGCSYVECDEDGYSTVSDYATNRYEYERNGWSVEVIYDCCGEWHYDSGDRWTPSSTDLVKAWGFVTEINAAYTDPDTGEETTFDADDLAGLWESVNRELKNIA